VAYPIDRGVPRLLPPALRTSHGMARGDSAGEVLLPQHMDQIAPVTLGEDGGLFDRIQLANQTNYGYEWQAFAHEYEGWEANYRRYYMLEKPEYFEGKLGLDGGCGMGRYSMIPMRWGAEVVGLDLSNAIDVAYQKSRAVPLFHAVQGDMFRLPFRTDQFDFCQSLGVIHITPDPEGALASLHRVVIPGGKIFIMVYTDFAGQDRVKHQLLRMATWLRRYSIRLRPKTLYDVLAVALPFVVLTCYIPSRVLWHLGARRSSSRFPYNYEQYSKRPFRDIHMNLFDRFGNPLERRYNREQMMDWLGRSGLRNFVLEHRDSWVFSAIKPVMID
jgi:SAM-dependent methyltransferase